MSQEINFAPPRVPAIPQVPLPQTNFGALEHTGLPFSEEEMITDVPPDFGWMSELQTFMFSFEFSKQDEIGTVLKTFSALAANIPFENSEPPKLYDLVPVWQHIPMTSSKYFNADISYKFIAIKPPRVTGKLLFRYSFLAPEITDPYGSHLEFQKDSLKRGICKEWDLGLTNEFEFDISALCPVQARPTWIPERSLHGVSNTTRFGPQQLNSSITNFGTIRIESAQLLQPGGIFPDSIRIQVFRVIKNATYYTASDFRSQLPHVLTRSVLVKPRSYNWPLPTPS